MSSPASFKTERALTAQRLAQYIARGRCERHLRFALFPAEAQRLLQRYGLEIEPLSPLLSKTGQEYEHAQFEELKKSARVVDMRGRGAEEFVEELKSVGAERTFYYQTSMRGNLGGWACEGIADLVHVERDERGRVSATVIDIKASRRETVGFRLQVAFYARLLRGAFDAAGIKDAEIYGAVAARDAELSAEGSCETFDLTIYDDEIERLVSAADSDVARAVRALPAEARYHLRASCDGCPYNQLCFADTAERLDLSLIPYLTVSEKRALQLEGVGTVRELAGLMRYGERGTLELAEGRERAAQRVASRWPLAARLPALVQRARSALRRLDRKTEAKRYLVGSDFGSLPDPTKYPDLVRVFVDAQRDYLEDRLYAVAARVVGPRGNFEVIEMTEGPPRADAEETAERGMLVAWVQKLLPAIARAADSAHATLHVYTYAPRGERHLLDALARHFDALCAVPAFYDLLTSRPALSQGMVSMLSEEVRARLNLPPVCQNLYEVARELGFEWRDGETDFRKIFRARVFDNRRTFTRRDEGGGMRDEEESRELSDSSSSLIPPPSSLSFESAARFGVEVPLEYAYAAWGLLKESGDAKGRAQLRGFTNVTLEQIRALLAARLRAMQHIEESFSHKNKKVEKEPLDLSTLDRVETEPEEIPLSRTLEDFLLLEHHARLQELMLHLALPPRERAETGRTAILRCESYEKADGTERARFRFSDEQGREARRDLQGPLKLRAGDWVVVNPLNDSEGRAFPAWRIVRGRLAVVEELTGEEVSLRLLSMNFKNSAFRFPHSLFAPDVGAVYTIDEMADDLNSDKFLDACRHAASNHLYRWITNADEGQRARAVRPKRLRDARELAAMASAAQAPHGLTRAQTEIVGERLTERVLVVQGPPGTGKSHTLGFAVIARALAQMSPARPFRIAVLAKTHAAVRVALESIAKRKTELLEARSRVLKSHAGALALLAPLAALKVVKVCNDADKSVPAGCESVLAEGSEDLSAAEQWESLLAEQLLVVGGTPGGLYRLVKQGASKGRKVDWTGEHFDLVVVDEASQMGLAEALTAAAFLREDGQFIAVGDHRQMPPILAHAWDQESRRDLKLTTPHLSVFEYLQKLGFARAALDESFRVPREIAEFLRRHVYSSDGIDFRSANSWRLPETEGLSDGWLKAALAPEHPLVVVEHDEAGSQQSNEFEARLVEELVSVASEKLNLDAARGIGVVVPHRAQKALLRSRLPQVADSIDTVERFQGGERDLIVVSATVSDREFAASESAFLMEPRRLTVAISRPTRKLIVIASRAVFDLIPADLDEYERGALWKHLRHESKSRVLWEGEVGEHRIAVRAVGGLG